MVLYSHSRIGTFEQCKLKYKYKYIDKIEPPLGQSIEAFMGTLVHETLEKLFKDLKFQKQNTLEELLDFFERSWKENWNDSIFFAREEFKEENFKEMGKKYIADFFNKHHPFNKDRTLGLEMEVNLDLNGDGRYTLVGYIDRLSEKDGVIEIQDYKTSNTLPTQENIDKDRQLALYSIAVKNMYPFAKKINLVWHYLAFNQTLTTTKTEKELEEIKKEIISKIDLIENEKNFEPKESTLCDWCEFQPICPLRKHLFKTKHMEINEFLGEDGVKLVNDYEKTKEELDRIEEKLEKIKEALFSYSEKHHVDNIVGSNAIARLRKYKNIKFPNKGESGRDSVENIIKKSGLWERFSTLDTFSLSRSIQEGQIPEEVILNLKDFVSVSETKRIYLSKK